MTEVRQWLEELGLAQYADAFESEDIDLAALRRLSEDDLKELGLTMGPRRKVQAAIAEMVAEAAAPQLADSGRPDERSHDAERRQITVMFCDLVGSTALSEQLDPEDMRGVMQAYRRACADMIARYGGHVAQYLGDGVMVYFGWPTAHEDDAQRAVQAGLDIVAAVATLDLDAALSVRIGVATGLVVVGESGADEGADAKLAVGETPNIAARIQGLAEPGTVTVAQSTRHLLGGAYELDDLGTFDAKGVPDGLHVHRVVAAAKTESRFEASQGVSSTPLVGRESEIAMLVDRWDQAMDGEGQVVLLSGEAGIGKSRVTEALRERLANEPHTRLRFQCSPYHTNSAFYPVIAQLERAAGFARNDEVDAKLDKLENLLGQSNTETALIAALLALPTDRYPPLRLSPQKQKEMTIAALTSQIRHLASSQPVLMIFEDSHWIDPTTLESLGAVVEAIQEARVLLVITFRPEFDPPWAGHSHVTMLALNRLGRKLRASMVAKVTGGKALPIEVLDQIIAKTDGIPLFVEELTKTVLEAGFLTDHGDAYTLEGPLPPLAIPATLQDSLMARLDRLSSVKEVAQIGACIGREFSYELVSAVSLLGDNELHEALQQLVQSELIFCRGTPPDALYTFKHALVRDAAYESLLKSNRRSLHGRIVAVLQDQFIELAKQQPELLAQHEEAAELTAQAIEHWREAGDRAVARSANREAVQQFERGLALIPKLADTQAQVRAELEIRTNNVTPLIAVGGHGAKEVEENAARSLALCDRIDEPDLLYPALYGRWVTLHARGEQSAARPISDRLLETGKQLDDRIGQLMGHRLTGVLDTIVGDLTGARKHLEAALTFYDSAADRELAFHYGQDPGVAALAYLALVHALTGQVDLSLGATEQALNLADEIGHKFTKGYALWWSGCIPCLVLSDYDRLETYAQQQFALCQAEGFDIWQNMAEFSLAYLRFRRMDERSKIDRSLYVFDFAETHWDRGTRLLVPYFFGLSAETRAEAGDAVAAVSLLNDALRLADEMSESWTEPEVLRIRGDVWHRFESDDTKAEADYQRSLDLARSQHAKLWELRTSISLARLWKSQDKPKASRNLLCGIYEWFSDDVEITDLMEAKALLDELN